MHREPVQHRRPRQRFEVLDAPAAVDIDCTSVAIDCVAVQIILG
jgi:hypothetical protein